MRKWAVLLIALFFTTVPALHAQVVDSVITEEVMQEKVDEDKEPDETDYFTEKQYQDESWKQHTQRRLPDSVLNRMQQDDDFWYANALFEKKKQKKASTYIPLGQRVWFKTLIWLIIIGGFVTVLIIYLAGSDVGLFRKKPAPLKKQEEEGEMPEDIFAINYQKEIDKAASRGDFRLAVRLMFLRLLKIMAERKVIQYKQDKTNMDYLFQLYPTAYHKDFFRITRHYEYSWYGKFDVSEDAFKYISNEINQFEKRLNQV